MVNLESIVTTDTEIEDCWHELQEAWLCLRDVVASLPLSTLQQALLLYIDEGMSWPSVRDLNKMKNLFLEITALVNEASLDGEIVYCVAAIRDGLHTLLKKIAF